MKTLNFKDGKTLLSVAIALIVIFTVGCNKKKQETANFVEPPFEQVDPEFVEFTIDNQSPDTLELESGTQIIVPANAFSDSLGVPAIGEITVNYREFHDALDIFLSGIPMNFNTRGKRKHLQTAGMFEIRAFQKGEELNVAEGQSVKIQMGSRTSGREYNFFGFNEENGNWEFMGYPESRENPEYQKTKEQIEELSNTRKFPLEPTQFIFDYTGALDIYKYRFNKKIDNKNLKERVRRYGLKWLNVDNRNTIYFNGNRYLASFMVWKKIAGKPFPDWLNDNNYFRTKMNKLYGDVYRLNISHSDGMSYTGKVQCIMPLRSLLAYSPKYWENNYQEAMKKMREEEKRLQTQAKVFRSFEINEMGVHNFDCLYKRTNPVKVKAEYTFAESYDNEMYELQDIYCLPGNNKTVIKLNPYNWDILWLDAEDENFRIITVLPGNKLGMYPLEKYRSLNFDSLRNAENPQVTFELKPKGKEIKSREQLEKLLGF